MIKQSFALLRTFVFAAFVPALALSLVACEPDNGEDGGGSLPGVTPEVTVPSGYENYFIEDLSFGRSSGEVKVAFQINVDWTMKVVGLEGASASWCSVEPASGASGLHKVIVRVTENDTYAERSAKVHLLSGSSKIAEIVVTQDYENAVLLGSDSCHVSFEAGSFAVEVKSNVDFECTVLDASWVRCQAPASRALTDYSLSFEYDENSSRHSREAHVVFYNSEYAVGDTLTVVQAGNPDASSVSAVDLGLSVKWASCNVGAESPEEYGDYFAWGETTTKSDYSSSTSVTYGLSISELESRGIIGADGNLTAAYDAATANWGGNWRMPTLDEMKELLDECTWEWTTMNGVYGRKVTGPNGNSIFLPAAGYRYGTSLYYAGSYGYYWSATPLGTGNNAYGLYFNSDYYDWRSIGRYYGQAVRPVSE